jgi:hypothetical protein
MKSKTSICYHPDRSVWEGTTSVMPCVLSSRTALAAEVSMFFAVAQEKE